jgi:hypothetical protein
MAPVVTCARSLYFLQLLPAGKLLRDVRVPAYTQGKVRTKHSARLRSENIGSTQSFSAEGIINQNKTRLAE